MGEGEGTPEVDGDGNPVVKTPDPVKPVVKAPEVDNDPDGLQDPAALKSALKQARADVVKHRTAATTSKAAIDALRVQVAKSLGIEVEDATPEKLAKQLAATQNELKKERIGNAFHRIAGELDADAELTLAYMEHKGMLTELDPADDDFANQLTEKVRIALKANPKLKATPTPGKSGAEFGGGDKKKGGPTMNDFLRKSAGFM